MKKTSRLQPNHPSSAFTLIELIVVIAVIGILAALIIPITGALDKKKKIALAQAQLKGIEAAIDGYKTKLGFYPPDNPKNVVTNDLYFELLGTTNNGAGLPAPTFYATLDGSGQIDAGNGDLLNYFGVQGLANTSTRTKTTDEGAAATVFLDRLTPKEVGTPDPTKALIKILVCSVEWPADKTPAPIPTAPALNPWRYNSSHPTNNTSTYDLWVDIVLKGKTNRVSNWSTQPIVL